MKKILPLILFCILMVSCGKIEITPELLEHSYNITDRSLQLSNIGVGGFINLNGLMNDTEVNNIYLEDNNIEMLNISEFDDVLRLDISNNKIRFLSDIKLPSDIGYLDISGNTLSNISDIIGYKKIKVLDVSYNNLDEDDFNSVDQLENLKYIHVVGNNVSQEFLDNIDDFNSVYLSNNSVPFQK